MDGRSIEQNRRLIGTWRVPILGAFLCLVLGSSAARAEMITFRTTAGSTAGGLPVDATARFTTSNGEIVILLTNLETNPQSIAQNLSDLLFTVSTGQTIGTLANSSGTERTVAANGAYSDASLPKPSGWTLSAQAGQFFLNDLGAGGAGPAMTIIGPPNPNSNTYSNADSSLTGDSQNNPFIATEATFDLSVPGVTINSDITSVTFSFGTGSGINVSSSDVPEPANLFLLTIAAVPLLARRRRC
jgi:hypothetical protein